MILTVHTKVTAFYSLQNLAQSSSYSTTWPYHVVFNCFLTFQADPGNTGSLGALDAANFMKKSGLNDKALSQVMIIITRLQTHVLTLLELTTKSEGKDECDIKIARKCSMIIIKVNLGSQE